MRIQKYLVITALKSRYSGFNSKVELKEREPNLDGNEVAVRLDIEIPDAFFKRPTLEAKLSIPTEALPKVNITSEVTTNVERLIKEATGLTMKVNIVEQEKKLPYEKEDTIERSTGDFTNLQKFKVGQQVRFYSVAPEDKYAGIHVVKAIKPSAEINRKGSPGFVIQTDRTQEFGEPKDSWVHVHWFAPVKK